MRLQKKYSSIRSDALVRRRRDTPLYRRVRSRLVHGRIMQGPKHEDCSQTRPPIHPPKAAHHSDAVDKTTGHLSASSLQRRRNVRAGLVVGSDVIVVIGDMTSESESRPNIDPHRSPIIRQQRIEYVRTNRPAAGICISTLAAGVRIGGSLFL